jgi:hypothetical protein
MSPSTEVPRSARRAPLVVAPERERVHPRHLDAEISSWVLALSGEPPSRRDRGAGAVRRRVRGDVSCARRPESSRSASA